MGLYIVQNQVRDANREDYPATENCGKKYYKSTSVALCRVVL